jgi:hypothetical protein
MDENCFKIGDVVSFLYAGKKTVGTIVDVIQASTKTGSVFSKGDYVIHPHPRHRINEYLVLSGSHLKKISENNAMVGEKKFQ